MIDPKLREDISNFLAEEHASAKSVKVIFASYDRFTHPRVAIFGYTGHGKSTFINALLNGRFLPAARDGQSVTPFPILIKFVAGQNWHIRPVYFSENEGREIIKKLIYLAQDAEADGEDVSPEKAQALKIIKAIVNGEPPIDLDSIWAALKPEVLEAMRSSNAVVVPAQSAPEVYSELNNLSEKATQYMTREVHLAGPAEVCRTGVEIVDLPGTGDAIYYRAEIAESYFDAAERVWILSDAVRAMNKQLQDAYGRLIVDGRLGKAAIILTKCDDLSGVDDIGALSDEDYILASNRDRVAKLSRSLVEIFPGTAESVKRLEIHSVGSAAYLKKMAKGLFAKSPDLPLEATGIPRIQSSVVAIGENFDRDRDGRCARGLAELLDQRLNRLYAEASGRLDGDLSAIYSKAASDCVARISERLLMAAQLKIDVKGLRKGWDAATGLNPEVHSAHFRTLQAICRWAGKFTSSTGVPFNLNRDAVQPTQVGAAQFLDEIEGISNEWIRKIFSDLREYLRSFGVGIKSALENEKHSEGMRHLVQSLELILRNEEESALLANGEEMMLLRKKYILSLEDTAKVILAPYYAKGEAEKGTGMKNRMLGFLGHGFNEIPAKIVADAVFEELRKGAGISFGKQFSGMKDVSFKFKKELDLFGQRLQASSPAQVSPAVVSKIEKGKQLRDQIIRFGQQKTS